MANVYWRFELRYKLESSDRILVSIWESCRLHNYTDPVTGRSRGFEFVFFKDAAGMDKVLEL